MNKYGMRWAGLVLAGVWAAGSLWSAAPAANAAAVSFLDVKAGHWAYSAVNGAMREGYVDGYDDATFKPDASVTRAEFVKMAVSALKLDAAPTGGRWYAPYVEAAVRAGLYDASDFPDSEAGWAAAMTREEMARVAARAIGEETRENDKWMYLATKTGLIQGVGKGQIAPQGLTTRAQSVVIIERIRSVKSGAKLEIDRYAAGSAEIAWHGTNIFSIMPEMFVTPESDWKSKGKPSIEDMWNEKNMTITSKDGLYQGKLDALIAIDMADANDPNRGLLGDVSTVKWYNNDEVMKNLIKGKTNTYVLYFKSHTVYNKDKSKYADIPFVQFQISGFGSPDTNAFYAGTLNKTAYLYRNQTDDLPAIIVPKSGTMQNGNDIKIVLQAPTGSNIRFIEIDLLRLRGLQ
ncbi:S-layer homology domain-containing protein [Saccharibacillus brassicae]|uniref:S-layer homology domain-containing protein n=1 Tax=Saccharibacillus brassicae TaxID=2583377 RepID=A0A4Y6USP2_SACBS|nr:S-layer homology domain-containing protein [Saccharibacillus brassicae]QDH19668.1 S-layer homology domain-containing protein [Saccharibacillus brassicae]